MSASGGEAVRIDYRCYPSSRLAPEPASSAKLTDATCQRLGVLGGPAEATFSTHLCLRPPAQPGFLNIVAAIRSPAAAKTAVSANIAVAKTRRFMSRIPLQTQSLLRLQAKGLIHIRPCALNGNLGRSP